GRGGGGARPPAGAADRAASRSSSVWAPAGATASRRPTHDVDNTPRTRAWVVMGDLLVRRRGERHVPIEGRAARVSGCRAAKAALTLTSSPAVNGNCVDLDRFVVRAGRN